MASTTDRSPRVPAPARFGAFANTLIVAAGYLFSRVLGLVREVLITAQFGTRPEMDAYRAAFSIVDMIYLVVAGGALGSAFIPIFSAFLTHDREEDAWRLASGVLNLALLALLVACALVALLADPIVALTVGSGFGPAQRALTAQIIRLLLAQPVLLGLGGLAKATLESFDRFALPAIGANLYNLGIIGGALLAPWLGIYGLVWGVVAGAALFLLIQLPGLRALGMRYHRRAGAATPGVRQVGRLLGPRLFGQSAWQLNLIAVGSFASTLGAGAVAANGYALQLMMLPHGLFALSLGTVIFPQLARHHAAGDQEALRATALGAVRHVLFLALPAAVLLAVLRLPLLRALFQRGAFDAGSATLTAEALAFYALGLAAFAAAEIIVRTFYAMHDTRTPVYVGIGAVAANIALGWTLLRLGLGLGGLALAFSLANTLEAITLLRLLAGRIGGLGGAFWRAVARMMLAALACGAAALALLWLSQPLLPFLAAGDRYRWPQHFIPLVLWLGVAVGFSALVYGGVAALFRLEELRMVMVRLHTLVARVRRR
jgi:putative peptidoglycan lipid II flippase